MKDSKLNMRISTRRIEKLRWYAAIKDKTVTAVVEELIDTLPEVKESPIK
jgi:hypothetical protein